MEQAEMNSQHAFEMEMTHTSSVLASLKSERDERSEAKATAVKTGAAAKADLAAVEALLADNNKVLMDTNTTFEEKKIAFGTNQQVREQELEALSQAITILQTPVSADSYAKHVKALLQTPTVEKAVSFLQMGSKARRASKQASAMQFLTGRAKALNSRTLTSLAGQMADSPFAKVIEIIESLLERLQDQAASEATHKSYCDEELKKNKHKRDDLTSEAARLRAEADAKAIAVVEMAEEISQLSKEQADLKAALVEATAVRTAEKEENEATIKDAKAGQVALKQALAVLTEFYSKQAGFAQLKQVPEMAEYKGMQGESGGVLGMLEVIQSDFARLETETTAAEAQASEEYKTFKEDSEGSIKMKHDAEFRLSMEKDQTDFEREQFEKNLAATTKELDAAEAVYDVLKPQCVEVNVSFEERAARRKDEIEALNQAYTILNSKSSE